MLKMADTAQTMGYSDSCILARYLQPVKTTTDYQNSFIMFRQLQIASDCCRVLQAIADMYVYRDNKLVKT